MKSNVKEEFDEEDEIVVEEEVEVHHHLEEQEMVEMLEDDYVEDNSRIASPVAKKPRILNPDVHELVRASPRKVHRVAMHQRHPVAVHHHHPSTPPSTSTLQNVIISPSLTADDLLQNYFNIVVGDGLPISFMNGTFSSYLFALINSSVGLASADVDPAPLMDMIMERAAATKNSLINDLQGKSISLLFEMNDLVKDVCVVLAQFFKNGVIVRRFLGIIELHESITQGEIADKVIHLCREYQIPEQKIYAVLGPGNDRLAEIRLPHSNTLPCLAKMFTRSVTSALTRWTVLLEKLGSVPASFGHSPLNEVVDEISACHEKMHCSKIRCGLTGDEQKHLEDLLDWTRKAQVVFDKITDPGRTKVITDVVASVFKFWIQLGKSNSGVAKNLAQSVKNNFCNELSQHEPINAAIFLDPRIQQLLSSADKTAAKEHLKKLHMELNVDENKTTEDVGQSEAEQEETDHGGGGDDEEDDEDCDLTEFLKKRTKSAQSEIQLSKIERVLHDFTDVPLLSARTGLLGYWDSNEREGVLKTLALIVHVIPSVQRNYIDANYIRQVRSNDGVHSAELQEAIYLVGGNLRLDSEGKDEI